MRRDCSTPRSLLRGTERSEGQERTEEPSVDKHAHSDCHDNEDDGEPRVPARPGEVVVAIASAPTELALALALEPALPALLRGVYAMGGAIAHFGNISPAAEANKQAGWARRGCADGARTGAERGQGCRRGWWRRAR